MKLKRLFPAFAATLVACGGGDQTNQTTADSTAMPSAAAAPAPAPTPPGGPLEMPEWFTVDDGARTAHMTITAGLTPANNHWNYNGATHGDMAITVPVGYRVTIQFTNQDPVMAHSLGVSSETTTFAALIEPDPVFEGAISKNPGSLTDGTMPGETEDIEFTASEAGTYSFLCYVPGHAAIGMWIYFIVSDSGEEGVQTR